MGSWTGLIALILIALVALCAILACIGVPVAVVLIIVFTVRKKKAAKQPIEVTAEETVTTPAEE